MISSELLSCKRPAPAILYSPMILGESTACLAAFQLWVVVFLWLAQGTADIRPVDCPGPQICPAGYDHFARCFACDRELHRGTGWRNPLQRGDAHIFVQALLGEGVHPRVRCANQVFEFESFKSHEVSESCCVGTLAHSA